MDDDNIKAILEIVKVTDEEKIASVAGTDDTASGADSDIPKRYL